VRHLILIKELFIIIVTISGVFFSPGSASPTPVEGPEGMAFYAPPSPLPEGSHGDLIWYRQALATPPGSPVTQTWNVLYHSTDGLGEPNVVTGTVMIPKSDWPGAGKRPIISYTIGTHGLCQSCAPSIQLEKGIDYESVNIAAALREGYVVVVTDNPGFTTGDMPTYMVGMAQGHAALDIIAAGHHGTLVAISG